MMLGMSPPGGMRSPSTRAEAADLDAGDEDARTGREAGGVVETREDRVGLGLVHALVEGPERKHEGDDAGDDQQADQQRGLRLQHGAGAVWFTGWSLP